MTADEVNDERSATMPGPVLVEKRRHMIIYRDDQAAAIGARIVALHEARRRIDRQLRMALDEQEVYNAELRFASLPTLTEAERLRYERLFTMAITGGNAAVIEQVYALCRQQGVHLGYRSAEGETMNVVVARRLAEIDGTASDVGVESLIEIETPPVDDSAPKMTVIVTGDRHWPRERLPVIEERLRAFCITSTRFIHGGNGRRDTRTGRIVCGVDMLADEAIRRIGFPRPMVFPYIGALGKGGGPARNTQMLVEALRRRNEEGDDLLVLAFHPNLPASKGTVDMMGRAAQAGVATELVM